MRAERNANRVPSALNPVVSPNNHKLLVSNLILKRTEDIFAKYHARRLEAVAYWHGIEGGVDGHDAAMSVVVPKARHSAGNFEVSVEETTKMGRLMTDMSLVCLAQIHTHPDKIIYQSWYDEQNALSNRDGFLSLIVPEYGGVSLRGLRKVTVYERWAGQWLLLSPEGVNKRIKIIDDFVDLR